MFFKMLRCWQYQYNHKLSLMTCHQKVFLILNLFSSSSFEKSWLICPSWAQGVSFEIPKKYLYFRKKWYYLLHLSNLDNGQGWPKMLHRNEHILAFQCILILIILKQTNFFLEWLNELSSFQALKSIRTCNQSLRAFPTSEVRQKFAKSLCVEININIKNIENQIYFCLKCWYKMPDLVMATFLMPNMMVKLKGGADFTSSVTRGPYLGWKDYF